MNRSEIGITAILIALLHENFAHILHDYCQNASCFTQSYWGTSALFALIFLVLEGTGYLPGSIPALGPGEQEDFQRAYETLVARASLAHSLQKQRRARLMIRSWRSVHIVLACLALLIVLFHGVMELLTNVLHIIKP